MVSLPSSCVVGGQFPASPVRQEFAALSSPSAGPSHLLPAGPSYLPASESVNAVNRPGFDKVDALACSFVSLLNNKGLALTREQVATISTLWGNLEEWDREKIQFASRHQEKLTTGRFRRRKASPRKSTIPRADSTTRCMLSGKGAPAQWPSCCRVVEVVRLHLANIHTTVNGRDRWSLLMQDYKRLHDMLLENSQVMETPTLSCQC